MSTGDTSIMSTDKYANHFVGGRGIGAKVYWDEVSPGLSAFDPQNRLVFATGPLTGITGLASSRWEICGKSPATLPQFFCHANLGGSWGGRLKAAGYDGLIIHGQAERPSYIVISNQSVTIRDASGLWQKGAIEVRKLLKKELGSSASVVASGIAGDNQVSFATLLADGDADGGSGFGAVFGSKNLKAIAVAAGSAKVAVADSDELRMLVEYARRLRHGVSTPELLEIAVDKSRMKKDICYHCGLGCTRAVYQPEDGDSGKYTCQSAYFYQEFARRHYGKPTEVPYFATKLCDQYGLDTGTMQPLIVWLSKCYRADVLTEENTELPLAEIGSLEFIQALAGMIARRRGFGDVLAQGIDKAADLVGPPAQQLVTDYVMRGVRPPPDARLFMANALPQAMEPRPAPAHAGQLTRPLLQWLAWYDGRDDGWVTTEMIRGMARNFFGGEVAVDFTTYDGKALAAKLVQDREFAKNALVLCSCVWPFLLSRDPEHPSGDSTLESRVFSAVTGREVDEESLDAVGERIFNLKRAILVREGYEARRSDVLPEPWYTIPLNRFLPNPEMVLPGRGDGAVSRKGAVIERDKFERLKDEYYRLRGWDVATGLQTVEKLRDLQLNEAADALASRGLAV